MALVALIFCLFVLIGMFSMDRSLGKIEKLMEELLRVERKSLDQQRENAKALQWVVDQSKQ